jgi:hypothetical protein
MRQAQLPKNHVSPILRPGKYFLGLPWKEEKNIISRRKSSEICKSALSEDILITQNS